MARFSLQLCTLQDYYGFYTLEFSRLYLTFRSSILNPPRAKKAMVIPTHLAWLVDTGQRLQTADGHVVEVWKLNHAADEAILSAWSRHFREHYCGDKDLAKLVEDTGLTNKQYLIDLKFPDVKEAPGPSIRAGDFAEIIVADFIEYKLGYWCPRKLRYDHKIVRNESSKGCDVIGFRIVADEKISPEDKLFIFETKAALSGKKAVARLQDAIDDSIKDKKREAFTLNALKQRLIDDGDDASAKKVGRFQNEADRPFKRINGAAAVHDDQTYDAGIAASIKAAGHFNATNLKLIVVTGAALMALVNALYERAADEA